MLKSDGENFKCSLNSQHPTIILWGPTSLNNVVVGHYEVYHFIFMNKTILRNQLKKILFSTLNFFFKSWQQKAWDCRVTIESTECLLPTKTWGKGHSDSFIAKQFVSSAQAGKNELPFCYSGPLHTRAKSRDHGIVRAPKKVSKGRRPNTPPTSCSVVMGPQV